MNAVQAGPRRYIPVTLQGLHCQGPHTAPLSAHGVQGSQPLSVTPSAIAVQDL